VWNQIDCRSIPQGKLSSRRTVRTSPLDYIGRFAPSPTGDLHFGSFVAALASYLQARTLGGRWLLRVEDIDPPREVPGSAAGIIHDLSFLGMNSDAPVLFQSTRTVAYQQATEWLLRSGQAYWCGCSRKDLPDSGIYPGTCRSGLRKGKKPRSVRIRVNDQPIVFSDRIQGQQVENLQTTSGDFVILRADGLHAYQLAVVLDDEFQNISEVVRGADLLESTARQIWLQTCLGFKHPQYAHIPLAIHEDGLKLSKSHNADPVRTLPPEALLNLGLNFLGQDAPRAGLAETWQWALENWSLSRVPGGQHQIMSEPL